MRWMTAVVFLALLSPPMGAQGRFAGGAIASGWSRTPVTATRGMTISLAQPNRSAVPHHLAPGAVFLGNPWLTTYEPLNPPAAPSPIVTIEAPSLSTGLPAEPPKSVEPLLIELRGGHYVRVPGTSTDNAPVSVGITTREETAGNKTALVELPPTVLVFHDGHREQLNEYSIIDSTLYTTGDYWRSGSWTRKIPLSALDLPATIAANHDAGMKFVLPSGPNVVVTRP